MLSSSRFLPWEMTYMTRFLRAAFPLLVSLLATGAAGGPAFGLDVYPLREVEAGQRAVAKSVFHGTKIESFNMEVIGVLEKFDGTRSVILGRILDGPVVARKSGVVGGMSGSPVYIDGRLVGAIALTWPWSKEPIAGITPIEDMLAAWEPKSVRTAEPAARAGVGSLSGALMVEGKAINRVHVSPGPTAEPDPPGVMTLVPLGGFVQVSGFNTRSMRRLSTLLEPYGLHVIPGASGGERRMRPPLVPGAALGARVVGGDFDMTAIGTLTVLQDDRVLAFGHPIFQRGDVDFPMTGGYVHDILPSLFFSSKIAAPTQEVGRICTDHPSAVAGEVGTRANLLPVSVEVEDRECGRARRFEIEVARLRELTPGIVAGAVMTAIDETRGRVMRGTSQVEVEVEVKGRPTIRRQDLVYSQMDAAAAALAPVLEPLITLSESPFGRLPPDSVRVKVEVEEARKTASIERVTVARSRVTAGDDVTLNVTLRPYGEDAVSVPATFSLPPDLPRGQIRIAITGGADAEQARNGIGAPVPDPISLDQLVQRYVSRERSSALVIQAALTRRGVGMLGEELPDLPRSAVEALRSAHPTDLRPIPSVLKVVIPTEWALTGRQVLALHLESPISAGPPGAPKPPSEQPPEEEEEEEATSFGHLALTRVTERDGEPGIPVGLASGNAEAGPEKSREEKKPKALTRAAESWTHSSRSDYRDAELDGVAVAEDGRVFLAPRCEELASVPADVVWSVAVRDGAAYLGTGTTGIIYRVSETGEVEEFFSTGEMNVHALAFGADGNLYAGTSPSGKLFRITPQGEGAVVLDSRSTYLWALALGPDGILYAGGGSPAVIYRLDSQGGTRELAALPAANVLSLALTKKSGLYAGTSSSGVVYHVDESGSARAVCQVSGTAVAALATDGEENLYAAGTPGGDIWRLPAGGAPVLWCKTGERAVYGLAFLPAGHLVAATGPRGLLVGVGEDRMPEILLRPEAGCATAIAEDGGSIFVASSSPCLLRKLGPGKSGRGSLESDVLDAGRTARWGRLEFAAEVPDRTQVLAETRSGESPDPGGHWSQWMAATDGAIASPSARYLQYHLILRSEDAATTPVVRQVRVSGRPRNRAPACSLKDPGRGDRLAGKHTVKWQARDPDEDELVCRLEVSGDLGRTWTELEDDLKERKYEWDTTKHEDGRYLLRVTASDSLSEPNDPETAEASIVIWVDNAPPELVLFRSSLAVSDEGSAEITGMASDALSPLRSIEYRVDEGQWRSLPLAAVETRLTDIAIATDPLDAGSHRVEARVFDSPGNLAADSVSVTVERPETATDQKTPSPEGSDAQAPTDP
jgi:outer membrane protein assembly factor BamB